MNVYMVICMDGSDADVKLVTGKQWVWIHRDPRPADSWAETDPGDKQNIVQVTCGSYENDRALQASALPGATFDSAKAALAFIKAEGHTLCDIYSGLVC